MPIIRMLGATFDPSYPDAFPLLALVRPDSLGVWGMLNGADASGNGKTLTGPLAYDAEGLVCTTDGGGMDTGVQETEELSIVVAHNIPVNATGNNNVISCINPDPDATGSVGSRYLVSGAAGSITVATGVATPVGTIHNSGGYSGAWTVLGIRIKNDLISSMRMAGTVTSTAITAGRKRSLRNFVINGEPSGGSVPLGINGKIGALAIYSSYLSDADLLQMIANTRAFMGSKGTPI